MVDNKWAYQNYYPQTQDIGLKSGYVKDRNGFFQIKTLKNTRNTLTRPGAYELQQREGVVVSNHTSNMLLVLTSFEVMMMATFWLLNKVDVNMLFKAHFQPNLGRETQKMMDKQYTVGTLLCLLSGLGIFLHTHV